jgi:hypothetical protein
MTYDDYLIKVIPILWVLCGILFLNIIFWFIIEMKKLKRGLK